VFKVVPYFLLIGYYLATYSVTYLIREEFEKLKHKK